LHTANNLKDQKELALTYVRKVAQSLSQSVEASASETDDECPVCLEKPQLSDAVFAPCAHMFCRDCLLSTLNGKAADKGKNVACTGRGGECPVCSEWIDLSKIIVVTSCPKTGVATTTYLAEGSFAKSSNFGPAKLDGSDAAARATLVSAMKGGTSSKMNAVLRELDEVWAEDPGSKVLIFSQYLGFLDLLQGSLEASRIKNFRLDGKMSLKERVAALSQFNTYVLDSEETESAPSPNVNKKSTVRHGSVFLLSMRAGGVGINLVAASSVFIVDPWWNAAVEDQCINRIHRIGQRADVVRVRRFVVEDSVEEKIVRLQQRKKGIAGEILDNGAAPGDRLGDSNPTMEDFKIIFNRSHT